MIRKTKLFGEVATFRNGLNFVRSDDGEVVKIVGVGDFQRKFRIGYHELDYVQIAGDLSPQDLLQNHDLLFVRSNGNKDLVGRCLLIEGLNEPASFSGFTIRARITDKLVDPTFVGYFFQSGLARRAINYAGGGTNISNLNQGVLSEIEVPTPPLPEQRKIAEILSAWDEALEKLDALIQAKERRKKALMQQLLTGKKRVKGFSEPWPLMGMLEVFNRIDRTVQGTPEYVLSITAGTGFVDQRVKFSRVIAGRNIENYILLRKGEFSYNKGNSDRFPQGCIYRLEEFNEGAVPNVWISFELKSNGYSQLFYKHFFLSGGLNHQLNQIINAGVRNDGLLNLTASNFFTVRVPVPQPEEQKKLGELFEFIDRELRLMRAQRDALGKR